MFNNIEIEHFRNLVSLVTVDGKVEELERVALAKIAFEKEIPLDRLNLMLERGEEYAFLIPQNHHDRESQLEDMIKIALVDGDFAKAELELIMKVGEKLDFSEREIEDMIAKHMEGVFGNQK